MADGKPCSNSGETWRNQFTWSKIEKTVDIIFLAGIIKNKHLFLQKGVVISLIVNTPIPWNLAMSAEHR